MVSDYPQIEITKNIKKIQNETLHLLQKLLTPQGGAKELFEEEGGSIGEKLRQDLQLMVKEEIDKQKGNLDQA